MITDYHTLSGLDKVSILFSVLGENLALTLIKGLSETDIQKIRVHIREMDTVSLSVRKQVVDEYYMTHVSKKFQGEEISDVRRPFGFLETLDDEQLVTLLEVEDARIIAIALTQISPERQMFVLNRMVTEIKGRVLIEMGKLDTIPLEAIVNIATDLEEKTHFLPRSINFSRGGGKNIAEILGRMSPEEEEKYISAISRESPDLMSEVKKYHVTFDDIFSFPDNILRDLMNSVDLDTVALALKGQPQEIVDRVINNLPQKKQAMYEPVEEPRLKRDIDSARKAIIEVARQMEKDDRFKFEDYLAGGEMIE